METVFPLYYFGNVGYWKTIIVEQGLSFATQRTIPKKSYANRTVILMANGIQTLTVPLIGGRGSHTPYQELEISYAENWMAKHKMALQSAYAKSPYYEYYMPYFELILNTKHSRLAGLNAALFTEMARVLKMKVEWKESERLPSINFIPNHFNTKLSEYPQVFRYKFPFHPDLSILDLLFCIGPQANRYLKT